MKYGRRGVLALCLAVVLTVTSVDSFALAGESQEGRLYEAGPCEHHQTHTEECGYSEEENSPCTYVCEACGGQEETEASVEAEGAEAERTAPEEGAAAEESGSAEKTAKEESTVITGWNWVDPESVLTSAEGAWELAAPGANQENPLTGEALGDMLPQQITVSTKEGDEETLVITWDLSSIPEEGVWDGEYALSASVPEGYSMGENVAAPAVTVRAGGAETYTTLPSGTVSDAPHKNHLVNGVTPNGTTINLFDYWLSERTASDNSNPLDFKNKGINQSHALLFGANMGNNNGSWNQWTSSASPRTGIVQTVLGTDGYPALNLEQHNVNNVTGLTGRDARESLAYLFNPQMDVAGKQSYADVKGLLQVDSEGYYHYDSKQNYAVFYEADNAFALYNQPAVRSGGGGSSGQFFPFNAAGDVFTDGYQMNDKQSNNSIFNHYFGLTMSTRFIQQYGGYTTATSGKPVTYTFSGDDDVWVFIDGKLVADLGGIHNAADLEINFASGEIKINEKTQPQTLGQILGTGPKTLPDNTYHTLDFFYLERGNVDSNMSLKYNLVTIPESSVIKVDQVGNAVAGAEFELYAANNLNTPIATGTTNQNGEFVFLDENDFPLTIDTLYNRYQNAQDDTGNHLILRETKVPTGYRTNGDIKLRFEKSKNGEKLLLSSDYWETGSYAMSKVTATVPGTIQFVDSDKDGVPLDPENNPLMFAVVFQKQDEAGNTWYPVSGDPIKGWNVAKDATWGSIKAAAKENPYIFQLASSGAYQVEVENLPGDVMTYYHLCQNTENAEYTVAYYYTEATTLDGIGENNTWRIDTEQTGSHKVDRVFSVNIYVPNIQNNLYVQKLDADGKPVAANNEEDQAEFALYKAGDITVNGDGTYTIHPGASAYKTAETGIGTGTLLGNDGQAVFESLEVGEYYLVETKAPQWYTLNPHAVHVVVDDTRVYADAGSDDDGVSVDRGVGAIVRSMVQFAADDAVNATLHDIKATPQTAEYGSDAFKEWTEVAGAQELHLSYEAEGGDYEYGPATEESPSVWSVETGWSRLKVQQCLDHDENIYTKKDDLGDREITSLFSGSVNVKIKDQQVGNLTVSKTVAGTNPPEDARFTFTVELKDSSGTPINGTFPLAGGSSVIIENGTTTVRLQKDQSWTIQNLLPGTQYTVTETDIPAGFTPSVSVNGGQGQSSGVGSGTIKAKERDTVAFTNTFSGDAVLTGVRGQKTLEGGTLLEGQFEFELTPVGNSTENIDLPNPARVSVQQDGSFSFGNIVFKEAGTYTFNIKEVLPTGVDAENPYNGGIIYDTHTTELKVEVTKVGNVLKAGEPLYSNEGAPSAEDAVIKDKAAFTNYLAGDFSFKKIDKANIPLSGAVFALYRLDCDASHDHSEDIIEAKEDGSLQTGHEYSECWTLVGGKVISSNSEGQVNFEGVPLEGEYRLVEVKAPDGYTKPAGQWTVEYDSTLRKFTVPENGAVGNPPAFNAADSTIINYKPGELPVSGNIGTRLFMILGGGLMLLGVLGGAIWYFRRRRVRG